MNRLLFGFLRVLSRLPLRVHYAFSDSLFPLVYHVIRYRRRLVRRQLTECFPEKDKKAIRQTERRFYHLLCDYIVETVKELTMTRDEMLRHVTFEGLYELQDEMERRGKQFAFAYLGHYGNWEWLASFALWMKGDLHASQIYHPLRNKGTDDFFLKLRSRFGGGNVPMKETLRHVVKLRKEGHREMLAFIADQSPKWEAMHHWTRFLGHDTSFFIGTEKIGKQVDAVIFYVHVTRPRRGYYSCQIVPISWEPANEPDYALTNRYAQMLEEQIKEAPELWLWTHNRWKRTKEEWEKRQEESRALPSAKGSE